MLLLFACFKNYMQLDKKSIMEKEGYAKLKGGNGVYEG